MIFSCYLLCFIPYSYVVMEVYSARPLLADCPT
jgi:hypothetical protein